MDEFNGAVQQQLGETVPFNLDDDLLSRYNVTIQHYQLSCTGNCLLPGENFGMPTSRANFQAPRGYRFTGLVRF